MIEVYVGVGSNIDKVRNIQSAIQKLARDFSPLCVSPVYQSTAFGFEGPDFHNLVIGFAVDRSAQDLYQILRDIEASQLRTRCGESFDSRTLDLDLLLYGDQCLSTELFTVPHLDIERYPFVLKPLIDLNPHGLHPLLHVSFSKLIERFEKPQLDQLVDVSEQYETLLCATESIESNVAVKQDG